MTPRGKVRDSKGFTLAELLIVVAIIAILVVISIPIFSGRLESARESTDKANERAAKAAMVTEYLEDQEARTLYYNAEQGTLVEDQGAAGEAYGQSADNKGKVIQVSIDQDGQVSLNWR
ncbi:MAG TPA: prepilin-type N-terminal cleavage/methylation domain-containing protein [Candidatus Blautia pullicola]|uniref:Prepilin-type N-terminal cleavage/methylation domain-containing protein n=1 Tax=Candidatus Blautia pullicola TaxID=2838498 RepID=A0A9D2JTJ6_9FIRM|nr:prepilin-type N-terminal cleavage/methylation domain-containing protein [Candidatus Blautia pullicola]